MNLGHIEALDYILHNSFREKFITMLTTEYIDFNIVKCIKNGLDTDFFFTKKSIQPYIKLWWNENSLIKFKLNQL